MENIVLNRIRHRAQAWHGHRTIEGGLEFRADIGRADYGFNRCSLPRVVRDAAQQSN
jgi:hypothetical protein